MTNLTASSGNAAQMTGDQIGTPDLVAIRQRQHQTWATGDYAVVGSTLVIMGELLCEALDLRAGQRVLDVATGNGNTALAAARRSCEAVGIDYVPALLDRARARATAEGLAVEFTDGDAEAIPFSDASFDVVTSTLGVMFTANQEQAAAELLRVCRSGGTIGLANWTPNGFAGQMFRVTSQFVPPPPGLWPPALWGTEARLRELLGGGIISLALTLRTFVFTYRSADHLLDVFRTYYGPVNRTFQALDTKQQAAYADALRSLMARFNRATDGSIAVESDYLEVVAVRA